MNPVHSGEQINAFLCTLVNGSILCTLVSPFPASFCHEGQGLDVSQPTWEARFPGTGVVTPAESVQHVNQAFATVNAKRVSRRCVCANCILQGSPNETIHVAVVLSINNSNAGEDSRPPSELGHHVKMIACSAKCTGQCGTTCGLRCGSCSHA